MEKITRDYAIIYIDYDGETLNDKNYVTKEMESDYYRTPGFLQWNYYLIVPNDLVDEKTIKIIEDDNRYTRKYVIERSKIGEFIDDRFPVMGKDVGSIKLVKGETAIDAQKKAAKITTLRDFVIGSWYRDESLMTSLENMDMLRANLIKEPIQRSFIFYTHLNREYNIAEKKFELFTK